ncbi:hypothetical protein DXG01_002304 [Tephrocybe rancida]|nr:hypothetical protein DXG01_002304 [Tephrocybe rancida]
MSKKNRSSLASESKAAKKKAVVSTRIRASVKSRMRAKRNKKRAAFIPPLPVEGQNADMVELPPVEPLRIKLGTHTIGASASHPTTSQYMTVIRPAPVPRGTTLIPAAYFVDTCTPYRDRVYDPNDPPRTFYGHLPFDVLCEIFVQCLSPELSRRTRRGEAPLVLCRVCRHWRRTALSMPILWSAFSAVKRPEDKLFHQKLLHFFLEYSRTRPLVFKISPPVNNRFMEILMTRSVRWKEATFVFDGSEAFANLFISVQHAPILESLVIDAKPCHDREILESLPPAMTHMTELRRLTWRSLVVPSTLLKIPFSQLSHFDLWCPISMEDCITVIRCCTNLVTLRVDFKAPSEHYQFKKVISIPTLTHLDVVPYIELADFLAHFHLPALRFIRVMHRRLFTHNFLGLEEFCARSGCTLETFWLNDRRQESQTVIRYLSLPCLQGLRELHIFAGGLDDSFINALMVPERYRWDCAGPLLLPRLKRLILGRCTTTDGLVTSMVESRCRSTAGVAAGTQLEMFRAKFRKGKNKIHTYHSIDILGLKSFRKSEVRVSWGWK